VRTYGRIINPDGTKTWVVVQTDAAGLNDDVFITTLIQCLKLNLGESPFYAQYGIPAHPSVVQQVFPDFYVAQTQQQFAPYFASLLIAKRASPTPTYDISLTTHAGVKLSASVPVPG
jgi:hypothetical protein